MLNRIILMGRLTRDPELRHTQTGTAVASFSLAVDRDFRNRDSGEKGVDFIDVVAWRNTAEFVSKYCTQGRMAVVEGRLQIRDWTDREGGKRRTGSFDFGGSAACAQGHGGGGSPARGVDAKRVGYDSGDIVLAAAWLPQARPQDPRRSGRACSRPR